MRILLLLAAVVLAFFTVRWFQPARAADGETPPETAGEAAREGEAPAGTGARFLEPPSSPPAAVPEAKASAAPAAAASFTPAEPAEASWPANLLASQGGTSDELALAAAVAHGTPAEVQAAAQGLVRDRALLLESFAWALAGERQVALSLSEKVSAKDSIDGRERALFEAALTGRAALPAASGAPPVARAMEMALLARDAQAALQARQYPAAARDFSALLLAELQAAWPADRAVLADWTRGLDQAQREHRWNPRSEWPAVEVKVESGDSLIEVRKRYLAEHPGRLLCTGLIERANRVKGYLQPGQVLKIPTDPARVLVDLEARWALFFLGEEVAGAWPVGIGRPGEDTPPGEYTVRNKLENPPWMKEGQEPIPFGDPRNPLGTRWMGWTSKEGARTSYGFHGTKEPDSIGQAASDGCVRFLNPDIEALFQILPEGAPIRIEG